MTAVLGQTPLSLPISSGRRLPSFLLSPPSARQENLVAPALESDARAVGELEGHLVVELDECEFFGAEVGDAFEGEREVERMEVDQGARP